MTSDELGVKSDGTVFIITKNKNPQRPEGTELVRLAIQEEQKCTIQLDTKKPSSTTTNDDSFMKNGLPGKGTDVTIYLNPTQDLTGTGAEGLPLFLVLGHELIHAVRGMNGTDVGWIEVNYYVDGQLYRAQQEELFVSGIWTQNESNPYRIRITENSLRKENGLKPRKIY